MLNKKQPAEKHLNSNILPSSVNSVRKMLDGKHFKKPQLVQKSKLNKYIETNVSTNDSQMSIPKFENESFSDKDVAKTIDDIASSNQSESKLNFSSGKLNEYVRDNDFQNTRMLYYLNVANLEMREITENSLKNEGLSKSHSTRCLVKPILELKTVQVE